MVCGLSLETTTLFLERNIAVECIKYIFFNTLSTTNKAPFILIFVVLVAEVSGGNITKPQQVKLSTYMACSDSQLFPKCLLKQRARSCSNLALCCMCVGGGSNKRSKGFPGQVSPLTPNTMCVVAALHSGLLRLVWVKKLRYLPVWQWFLNV